MNNLYGPDEIPERCGVCGRMMLIDEWLFDEQKILYGCVHASTDPRSHERVAVSWDAFLNYLQDFDSRWAKHFGKAITRYRKEADRICKEGVKESA